MKFSQVSPHLPPSPALVPGQLGRSEQSRKARKARPLQRNACTCYVSGPELTRISASSSSSHSHGSFPYVSLVFCQDPKKQREKKVLLHLRSKHASTFPYLFSSFFQSPCNRTTDSERLLLFNIHGQADSKL